MQDPSPAAPTGTAADTGTQRKSKRSQVRWLMVILVAVATAIAYIDRANLSVASDFMQDDLQFSNELKGVMLSSFFWTYAIFQLPGGWLVDRFGPRALYAIAVVWWSIGTAATALTRGIGGVIGCRLGLGIGEAPVQSANARVVSEWFPRRERAFASSIFDTGSEFGSALSVPLVTALIALVGWRGSFVATGALGLVWVVVWLLVYRSPRKHKWANQSEVDYIEQGGGRTEEKELEDGGKQPMKWRDLFRYSTTWALVAGYTCRGVIIYFFITWYPDFLINQQGFSMLQLGLFGAIPGLAAMVANWLGGLFSDWLVRRGTRIELARKIPLVVGMLGASTIALASVAQSPLVAMTCLTVSYCSAAVATGALLSLPADVAPTPRNVASLTGVQNFGSQLGGIIGPIAIGFLLGTGQFAYVWPLVFAGAMCVLGALTYAFLVQVKPLDEQKPMFSRA
ncbi:MFS transporter [Saccharopolyspora halophila]|uniref:MFS transporter n=1 Tax=Saccharopolyspora halophila TaxID=405551 RepID=A0ABP5TMY7_9PSEU